MEWNSEALGLNNNMFMQHSHYQEAMKELDFEELAQMLLGDDCHPSSLFELQETGAIVASSSIEQLSPPMPQQDPNVSMPQSSNEPEQNHAKAGKRRKRRPKQIEHHIIAERKRRELLAELFISLSAIVPDLKKVDKLSIMTGAIEHIKELVVKVKALEEAAAKQRAESMVRIKRSKMVVDNEDDSSYIVEDVYVFGGSDISSSLPEIEVTVADNNNVILRFYCKKQTGILGPIIVELERHGINVLHNTIVPHGNSVYNYTLVGQADNTDKKLMKDLVTRLRLILHNL